MRGEHTLEQKPWHAKGAVAEVLLAPAWHQKALTGALPAVGSLPQQPWWRWAFLPMIWNPSLILCPHPKSVKVNTV